MQNSEIDRLQQRISEKRKSLVGLTFNQASEDFKNLEGLKVRLLVAKNPNHFAEKYAELDAKRRARKSWH